MSNNYTLKKTAEGPYIIKGVECAAVYWKEHFLCYVPWDGSESQIVFMQEYLSGLNFRLPVEYRADDSEHRKKLCEERGGTLGFMELKVAVYVPDKDYFVKGYFCITTDGKNFLNDPTDWFFNRDAICISRQFHWELPRKCYEVGDRLFINGRYFEFVQKRGDVFVKEIKDA